MRQHSSSEDPETQPQYHESTIVVRPGETVRSSAVEREERVSAETDSADDEAGRIRVEIEETRVEMSETVDAIQEKLNPEVIVDQAKEAVREAAERAVHDAKDTVREATLGRAEQMVSDVTHTAQDARLSLMDTIKQNPVPAAVAALSLAWLYRNRSRASSGQARYGQYGYQSRPEYYGQARPEYYAAGQTGYVSGQSGSGSSGNPVSNVVGQVGETAGQVRGAAGEAVSRAGEMASGVASGAGEMASDVMHTTGQAIGSAGETARDVGTSLMETIRQNPLPAALTGVGLAWLLKSRSSSDERPYYARSRSHYWQGNEAGYSSTSGYSGTYSTGEQSGGVGQVAGQAKEQLGQVAGQVQDRAGQMVGQVQDTAGDVVDNLRWAPGRVRRMAQESPLMAGALAVAVGAAVGLVMPETEREQRVFGDTRDRLMEQAKETVQETVQKVQTVAGEARTAAEQSAREEQLTR